MSKISVIVPAYKAQDFIFRSVGSVLNQTYKDYEILIISDDNVDYQPLIQKKRLDESKIRYLSTDGVGKGASYARNIGLQNASGNIISILDADDTMHPEKLEICSKLIKDYPFISCSVSILNHKGQHIRNVGKNKPTGELSAKNYKSVNYSTDSMITFDKRVIDCHYNTELNSWNDFEFIIQSLSIVDRLYHLSEPYHNYYKQPDSISNNDSSHSHYIKNKVFLKDLVQKGHYNLNREVKKQLLKFIDASIEAEKTFHVLNKQDNSIIFENVIEPLLQ